VICLAIKDHVQCEQLVTANRWGDVCRPTDTAGMTKKPEPPKLLSWSIYEVTKKAIWLPDSSALAAGQVKRQVTPAGA